MLRKTPAEREKAAGVFYMDCYMFGKKAVEMESLLMYNKVHNCRF